MDTFSECIIEGEIGKSLDDGFSPPPILPYASPTVCKTLSEQGLDAAVAQWNSLQSNHPGEYDFSLPQFDNLLNAVGLKRVQDAETLARLCARILPEPDLKVIEDELNGYQHAAARVVSRVIREHRNGSASL